MSKIIVTINAGSSNIKLAIFDAENLECLSKEHIATIPEAVTWFCQTEKDNDIVAVGHRIVHGGRKFNKPVALTAEVMTELNKLTPLDPIHQPYALDIISEISGMFPDLTQVGCFDTAFHHTVPQLETMTTLPIQYYEQGIQRYGFHGLSYEYISSVLPQHAGGKAQQKVVVAHLGSGSSMCAMQNLKSVATTMGFSTLDGLMMGTRTGSIDPGILLYLMETMKMTPAELSSLLYHDSGLKGVSGIDSDMVKLLASEKAEAKLAIELYCYIAAKNLGSLITVLGGIDVLVFTGGIGENSAKIRELIGGYLKWLPSLQVLVIPTNEELIIAKSCKTLLANKV